MIINIGAEIFDILQSLNKKIHQMDREYVLFLLAALIASLCFIGASASFICWLQLRGEIHLSASWIEHNISNPVLLGQDGWMYFMLTSFGISFAFGLAAYKHAKKLELKQDLMDIIGGEI